MTHQHMTIPLTDPFEVLSAFCVAPAALQNSFRIAFVTPLARPGLLVIRLNFVEMSLLGLDPIRRTKYQMMGSDANRRNRSIQL